MTVIIIIFNLTKLKLPYYLILEIILPNRNYNWAFNETLLSDSKSKSHSNSFATIFQDQDGNKNEGLL